MELAKMDLVLINPPNPSVYEATPHMGLHYLSAAATAQGFRVVVLDAPLTGMASGGIVAAALKFDPAVIGVSIPFQDQVATALRIAELLRAKGFRGHLTLGGHTASFAAPFLLSNYASVVDSVFVGEAEGCISRFLEAYLKHSDWTSVDGVASLTPDGRTRINAPRYIANLDDIPFPHTISEALRKPFLAPIVTSRGCSGRCTFCSIGAFHRLGRVGHRVHSPQRIQQEVKWAVSLGASGIRFWDEDFIGPDGASRCSDIAEVMSAASSPIPFTIEARADRIEAGLVRQLKNAGLRKVFVGVEAMAPTILEELGKGTTPEMNLRAISILRDEGVEYDIGYIMMTPESTVADIREQLKWLNWFGQPNFFHFSPLIVYLGTPIYKRLQASGRLMGEPLNPTYSFPDSPRAGVYQALLKVHDTLCRLGLSRLRAWQAVVRQGRSGDLPNDWLRRTRDAIGAITAQYSKALDSLLLAVENGESPSLLSSDASQGAIRALDDMLTSASDLANWGPAAVPESGGGDLGG